MNEPRLERRGRGDDYVRALDHAEQMLGTRLEPFLAPTPGESDNAADFKRIATVHAFGDVWPRTEYLDSVQRSLVSVAIAATLGAHEPLRGQVTIALHVGASKEQVTEVFIQVAAYAGVARAFEGYAVAADVFARTKTKDSAATSPR